MKKYLKQFHILAKAGGGQKGSLLHDVHVLLCRMIRKEAHMARTDRISILKSSHPALPEMPKESLLRCNRWTIPATHRLSLLECGMWNYEPEPGKPDNG